MQLTITDRNGAMRRISELVELDRLISELDSSDAEHPDVAASNPDGWTLSAYSDGRVVWENVEEDVEPRHMLNVKRTGVREMMAALGNGDLESLETQAWLPGYKL